MKIKVETIFAIADKKNLDIDFSSKYGEPGYSSEKGIFFANWNNFPSHIAKAIENAGFDVEWSDEWMIDHNESKAYRCQPDSYSWVPSYIQNDWTNGEIIGKDTLLEDKYLREDYIMEFLGDNPDSADTFGIDLSEFNFELVNEDSNNKDSNNKNSYENGFHPGQNDEPGEILLEAQRQDDKALYVFQIEGVGQFESSFNLYKLANYWG